MKIKLISYANKAFYKSQQELKKSALKYGVNEVIDYNEIWLKKQTEFYKKNKKILSQKRGNGFWLWKPYIILDALKLMNDGDILIHIDAGTEFINPIGDIINVLRERDLLLFYNNGNINKLWTKRDCFYYMDCDNEKFHNPSQVVAGYIFCKKTPFVVGLMEEWLKYAEDERIISDNPNTCGLKNYDKFKDHRHDQSILTNLAIKYNLELFRDPSQWGNKYKMETFRSEGEINEGGYVSNSFLNSPYSTILNSHRTKLPLNFFDHLEYNSLRFKK